MMFFFMNLAVGTECIMMALGQVKQVLYCGLVGSWFGQVPAAIAFTAMWKNVGAVMFGVSIGYGILVLLFAWCLYNTDWEACLVAARRRAGQADDKEEEELQDAT